MTQKNVKFFPSVSKSCPEIGFLTGKFVQLSQNAAFHDHIENVATLNVMVNSGETLVINTHHLLWVTVQGCSLHLNDKCMATFFFWAEDIFRCLLSVVQSIDSQSQTLEAYEGLPL